MCAMAWVCVVHVVCEVWCVCVHSVGGVVCGVCVVCSVYVVWCVCTLCVRGGVYVVWCGMVWYDIVWYGGGHMPVVIFPEL
jgi:hypothetical protein